MINTLTVNFQRRVGRGDGVDCVDWHSVDFGHLHSWLIVEQIGNATRGQGHRTVIGPPRSNGCCGRFGSNRFLGGYAKEEMSWFFVNPEMGLQNEIIETVVEHHHIGRGVGSGTQFVGQQLHLLPVGVSGMSEIHSVDRHVGIIEQRNDH